MKFIEQLPEIKNTVLETIGETALVQLREITKDLPKGIEIWVKMESMNPGGSVKDRAGLQMIIEGIRSKKLTPDKVILDSTSGNTGIALALVGSVLGYDVELVMPENVSQERKSKVSGYGAKTIFSSPLEGSDGAIIKAREILEGNAEKYFKPDQYNNSFNPMAHYHTTGPEIMRQTDGRVSHFVATIGTSGTIMGTGRYLKEQNSNIQIIAVEPDDAFHGLEGLKHMKSSIVPGIYQKDKIDRTIPIPTEASYEMARTLAKKEGIFPGQSAGGAVRASLHLAQELASQGVKEAMIVSVICDSGDKYFSKGLWDVENPEK